MFLVVCLGNPGKEYENTRHNAGFILADYIAQLYNFSPFKLKFQSHISEGFVEGKKIILQKPLTYMNRSGGAVSQAANFFKIDIENIIVVHDDLDLLTGKIRVKTGGGNGGHNGLKDIDACIGKDYKRIRIGIGHPGDKNRVADYVLSNFSKDERIIIDITIENIAKHFGLALQEKPDLFMTKASNNAL